MHLQDQGCRGWSIQALTICAQILHFRLEFTFVKCLEQRKGSPLGLGRGEAMSTLQPVSPGRFSSFRETRQRPTCFLVGSIWDLPLPLDPSTQTLFLPFPTNILSTSVCLTITMQVSV